MYMSDSTPAHPDHEGINHGERLLTASEAASYLRIHVKKVYSLSIPQVRISDRRVRYLMSDLVAYVRRHRRAP